MALAQNETERLLSILHAHGQQFLGAFDIPVQPNLNHANSSGSEEEWTGINPSVTDEEQDSDFEQDDDFVASSSRTPDVTVFLESTGKRPEDSLSAKELRKSFMSSKVSNIISSAMPSTSVEKGSDRGSDDERTNAQNDALLHRLVHTRLLSGSLNPELNLDHAQKGRALAGRVLELAGDAKLGKGEGVFRLEQRNHAAKHVRDGLMRKQRKNEKKALEEAKNMGNYHPTLKRLYDSDSPSIQKKKRPRGLAMGVGRFTGGTLKLRRDEIALVTGTGKLPGRSSRRGTRRPPH